MCAFGRAIAMAMWILAPTVPAAAATPTVIPAAPGHSAHMPTYAVLGGARVSATTTGSHTTVAAASGHPPQRQEPTCVWRGIRGPAGRVSR